MPTLEELMAETQRQMSRNLAEDLFGPNARVSFLGHTVTPRPRAARIREWIGERFLWVANKLGAYNDDY